jgi:glutamate synthase domain-containing protein 2
MLTRYFAFIIAAVLSAASILAAATDHISYHWTILPLLLLALGCYNLLQRRHSVLRNYPIIGHFRYGMELIRPEIRQYFFESDTEELPFSRAQRSVVYQRAKNVPDGQAFGTKKDIKAPGHEWITHSISPTRIDNHDFRVTIGAETAQPYSMSIFNISAMSFGALSANAILSLNLGAKLGNFTHDTGEGSVSRYHRQHGGDLIWEIGSGYFGCRNNDGTFSSTAFAKTASADQIKMIEIKLSQGAKPGHGGILPAAKVTPEIAEARGIPVGVECISPAAHSAFSTPKELLLFIQHLRTLSGGKPTGIKLCIGHGWEFMSIAKAMLETNILPDFIVIDGAEGGTGAAPVEFTDHVGAPLQEGLLFVHNILVGIGLRDRIKLGASGKIITAFDIAKTLAIGADFCNSARGFMFAIGCIQAATCGNGKCPSGVATQDPLRQRAIDVPDKSQRVASYHQNTLHALKELVQAAGLNHPGEFQPHHIVRRISKHEVHLLSHILSHLAPMSLIKGKVKYAMYQTFWERSSSETFALQPGIPAQRKKQSKKVSHTTSKKISSTTHSTPKKQKKHAR